MGLLDAIDRVLGTRIGLLVSDPRAAVNALESDARAFNQASLLATQAERNAARGLPVSPEQLAAKQYIDRKNEELAMGFAGQVIPTRQAALDIASKNAEKMLGLPPNNTAMDRAKAMGFDTAGFRGSSVEELSHQNPIWWSEDPQYASAYAAHIVRPPKGQVDPYAGNVMPLLVKQGKSKEFEKFNVGGVPLDPFKGFESGVETGLRRYAKNEITGDMGGKIWEALTIPKNVRSRFAAFDPARVNEADLLAAGIPFGLLAGTNIEMPKKKEKKK